VKFCILYFDLQPWRHAGQQLTGSYEQHGLKKIASGSQKQILATSRPDDEVGHDWSYFRHIVNRLFALKDKNPDFRKSHECIILPILSNNYALYDPEEVCSFTLSVSLVFKKQKSNSFNKGKHFGQITWRSRS